ncbi:hypothetical protein O5O45_04790 [Hahella aquimaris]|uniref:hypothetical protein n=1 Tax=Hahella sp. HNIBRBA332 TaxID=3015983 RepID=UPI00273AAF7E|nr:hypothetical protein [Hahella sp. HNIBRBA332]WLQ15241.1 hypothetical protein O5O45_04790 [Hahella sp. HNIBRBA332]
MVMKAPLVDHSWEVIGEEKHPPRLALKEVLAKMEQLKKVAAVIQKNEGSNKLERILRYTCLMHTLAKCKDFLEDDKDPVREEHFQCLFAHATSQLFEAQQRIDAELGHLDL